MDITNVLASVMTSDIKISSTWYEALFGRKADYSPMPSLQEWDFRKGGVLQLVEDNERAGRSSITFLVADIENIKRSLVQKNISIRHRTESSVAQTITIFDPENNRITFAANLQDR